MTSLNFDHNPESDIKSVLIYGMGMMGASLALALKSSPHYNGTVTGVVRSEKSAAFIRQHHMADDVMVIPETDDIKKIPLQDFDMVVIGLPVRSSLYLLEIFPSYNGLITDMSSTQQEIHNVIRKRPDLRFVGSHPMCGTENTGPSAARADLYLDRLCLITGRPEQPDDIHLQDDINRTLNFWQSIGMKVFRVSPEKHDEFLSYLSHSPHILSGLIAVWAQNSTVVQEVTNESPMPVTGGGFRDMVRIAGANPEMWTDILQTNRSNVVKSLREFQQLLSDMIQHLEKWEDESYPDWFSQARKARNLLSGYPEDK